MIEADAYALSYPKAGRTWLRALVGKVLADSLGLSERRILETEFLARRAGVRVLLLGRDVRDNLVSAYFQATRRIDVWQGQISPFLRDDRYGVDKLLT